MVKLRNKKTGKVKEFDRSTAHMLIEKGDYELADRVPHKAPTPYQTRQVRPGTTQTK